MKTTNQHLIRYIRSNPNWFLKKYDRRRKMFCDVDRREFYKAASRAYRRHVLSDNDIDEPFTTTLRRAYFTILERSSPHLGRYQKVAMRGYTWLYMCSPSYGFQDYNRFRLMFIPGNEKACDFLIRVSQRVAAGR